MEITCVWEHHGNDSLLYSSNLIGAFTRDATKEEAVEKMPHEVSAYIKWMGGLVVDPSCFNVRIVQKKASDLNIKDADSDILFDSERTSLPEMTNCILKRLDCTYLCLFNP